MMQSIQTAGLSPQSTITGRILVVDDNESNRDMLSRRLTRWGYEVEMAPDGRSALEMVHRKTFDLVLLDIMMPALNGFEVLEQLKKDDQLRRLPVLMISAVDDLDSVVRCIELGADDYLPKPFNPTLLKARVEASLAKKYLNDRERLHAESLERELEIGRQIQGGFLPAQLIRPRGWDIDVYFQPARQVAGDFYDVFDLGPGRIGLVIADVCGKGVGAALFMALFRSLIRAYAEQACLPQDDQETTAETILLEAIRSTNAYITRVHKSAHMFASVFFGVLYPESGRLFYLNAGHLPPIALGNGNRVRRLNTTGPAVGVMAQPTFSVSNLTLAPGELLVAFTDGVTEARNGSFGFFSEERLLGLLSRAGQSPVSAVLGQIKEAVDAFADQVEPSDDLTVLGIKRLDLSPDNNTLNHKERV